MKEITLTKMNFQDEVLDSTEPVLVDFWATWCGPCKMIAPVLEKIAEEDKIKVGKVNVDEQMELAVAYGIEVIPTLLFFKNGQIVKKSVGFLEKSEIESIISNL
ncbi:MAG: thioredoxin [Clostridiales bacterium]|jgi:thioredoxin 1|nr:thioredoxin [Clostridiales bacterium]